MAGVIKAFKKLRHGNLCNSPTSIRTMKTLQKFTPEYLENCRKMTPEEIVKFLDQFRLLHYLEENKLNNPKPVTL